MGPHPVVAKLVHNSAYYGAKMVEPYSAYPAAQNANTSELNSVISVPIGRDMKD